MMVILGMTHSSKNIVGLNHILEMTPGQIDKNPKEMIKKGLTPIKYVTSKFSISFFLTIESSYVIVIAFTYQFLDQTWWLIQFMSLIAIVVVFIYSMICVTESPRYYYNNRRFDESRECLQFIANFNGCTGFT